MFFMYIIWDVNVPLETVSVTLEEKSTCNLRGVITTLIPGVLDECGEKAHRYTVPSVNSSISTRRNHVGSRHRMAVTSTKSDNRW